MSESTTEEQRSDRLSSEKTKIDEDQAVANQKTDAPHADDDASEPVYPTGLKLTLIITSLCLAVFLVALDQTIIAPALGAITADYKSVKDIVS